MKTKTLSLLLALCLLLGLAVPATAATETARLETVRSLGIMTGDEYGNMNLGASVTRAEFVKMMSAASVYKDSMGGGSGYSLFTDVKNTHWASEYIKLAIDEGWVTGYVDGSFRPDYTITLEEACTALLRMLGYDSGSLAGSFPQAQLSKSAAIGLRDDLSATQGAPLTRQDCVTLFYNLLTVSTSEGKVYGTTLGYTITNGEVDYASLVGNDTKGPYISRDGSVELPFSTGGTVTVYRNGSASSLDAVTQYDVYYYNEGLRTVWVYTDRITGTLTAVSPNRAAPTSVTVAGQEYTLGSTAAAYALSAQGGFADGTAVTLLLGMNGDVVEVLSATESSGTYYGVVVASSKTTANTAGSASVKVETQVACSDGSLRTFYHSGSALSEKKLVSVTVDKNGTTVKGLTTKQISGNVNSAGTKLGSYTFAPHVEILDTDDYGGYASVYPSRLAGVSLLSKHVRYYTLDENGQIDRLILNSVTGDTASYAYMVNAKTQDGDVISGSYEYILNGKTETLSGSTAHSISAGGVALTWDGTAVKSFRQLKELNITQLSGTYAMVNGQRYLLADDVQVLLREKNGFYPTTLQSISGGDYELTGWYDDLSNPAGGRIRILIAS